MKTTFTVTGWGRRRLIGWAWSGLSTTAAQAAVQCLGFIAGILIVRFLAPREYAFYTIATAGLGTMTVLTDSGIGSSVLALGGGVYKDPTRLGAVLATGIALRRRFSRIALAVGVPLMIALLKRQGASWGEATLVAVSIVPLFLSTVTGHLLEAVPRLHQTLTSLQLIQGTANAGRLLLTAALVPIWPIAPLASLVAALPQWWANLRLRSIADQRVIWRRSADAQVASRMASQLRRTMPAAIYYALSGQLTVWLISLFGKSNSVAAIGALGRLAMALAILSAAFNAVAVPRFARIAAAEPGLARSRYLQAQLALMAACLIPMALLICFPAVALALLGASYGGLQHEVVLMGLGSCAATLCGASYTLGAARGIVTPATITIPYSIAGQALFIALLPLNTVSGVIWVGLLSAASQWLLHVLYFEWHYRQPPSSPVSGADAVT